MKYEQKFIYQTEESFSTDKALKGVTLASVTQVTQEGETRDILTSVEDFRKVSSDKYAAVIEGVTHYFNSRGECTDDSSVGSLSFVTSDIEKSIDNAAESGDSGGDTDKKATISSLNPRDYFAQEVMNGFMKNVDKPFNMSDADIYKYTTLAYKIAQSMINVSADNRSTDPESEGEDPPEVVVDPSTLNGNTEKLLNNMVTALTDINNSIEDSGGGGGESTFDGNLTGWPTDALNVSLSRGASSSNPIYMSCKYPDWSSLTDISAVSTEGFPVYSSAPGNPQGKLSFDNLKGAISNYLETNGSNGGLDSLKSALLSAFSSSDIYNIIRNAVIAEIQAYINAATVTIGGTTYNVVAHTPST